MSSLYTPDLSLFEIAKDWQGVSDEDVTYFKNSLYNEYPNTPRGPMATQWTPPGRVKLECEDDTCHGCVIGIVDKFWLIFPGTREVYTIDSENKFNKEN